MKYRICVVVFLFTFFISCISVTLAEESSHPLAAENGFDLVNIPVTEAIQRLNDAGYRKATPDDAFSEFIAYENGDKPIKKILLGVDEDTYYTFSVVLYCRADKNANKLVSYLETLYGKSMKGIVPQFNGNNFFWLTEQDSYIINVNGSLDDVINGKKSYIFMITSSNKNTSDESDSAVNADFTIEDEEKNTPVEIMKIGDTIQSSVLNMTLQKAGTANELYFTVQETKDLEHHLSKNKQNATYIFVRGTIKNKAKTTLSPSFSMIGKMIIDGYEYDISMFMPHLWVEPLDTQLYILYALVPNELAQNYNSCVIQFGVNDDLSWAMDYKKMNHVYEIKIQ